METNSAANASTLKVIDTGIKVYKNLSPGQIGEDCHGANSSLLFEHFLFSTRRQSSEESLTDFLSSLKILFDRYGYEPTDGTYR